jgi:hypothetical protein
MISANGNVLIMFSSLFFSYLKVCTLFDLTSFFFYLYIKERFIFALTSQLKLIIIEPQVKLKISFQLYNYFFILKKWSKKPKQISIYFLFQ